MAGAKGHVATMDWDSKALLGEFHLMKAIRDVKYVPIPLTLPSYPPLSPSPLTLPSHPPLSPSPLTLPSHPPLSPLLSLSCLPSPLTLSPLSLLSLSPPPSPLLPPPSSLLLPPPSLLLSPLQQVFTIPQRHCSCTETTCLRIPR